MRTVLLLLACLSLSGLLAQEHVILAERSVSVKVGNTERGTLTYSVTLEGGEQQG